MSRKYRNKHGRRQSTCVDCMIDAEIAKRKQPTNNPQKPPCMRGKSCEWARDNGGGKITCLRIVAGCVK